MTGILSGRCRQLLDGSDQSVETFDRILFQDEQRRADGLVPLRRQAGEVHEYHIGDSALEASLHRAL